MYALTILLMVPFSNEIAARMFFGVAFNGASKHSMNSYSGVLTNHAAEMKLNAEDGRRIFVNASGRQCNQPFRKPFATKYKPLSHNQAGHAQDLATIAAW